VQQRVATTRLNDGTQIAYATAGQGPFLGYAPGWITHPELSWALPPERSSPGQASPAGEWHAARPVREKIKDGHDSERAGCPPARSVLRRGDP
jgi:hypothetical protein